MQLEFVNTRLCLVGWDMKGLGGLSWLGNIVATLTKTH